LYKIICNSRIRFIKSCIFNNAELSLKANSEEGKIMQSTYNGMIQHKTPITENKQKFGVLGLNHVVEPPPTAR
jgi:hypothetical protein